MWPFTAVITNCAVTGFQVPMLCWVVWLRWPPSGDDGAIAPEQHFALARTVAAIRCRDAATTRHDYAAHGVHK